MDTTTPSLSSNPASIFKRIIFYFIVALVLLMAILGGILWYANQNKQVSLIFDPTRQVIPKGATSQKIDQSLAVFGFSSPLPFFDERNVVQSLSIEAPSSSTKKPYISYRVYEQDINALRDVYRQYFNKMGWGEIKSASYSEQTLFFRASESLSVVQILFLKESPDTESVDQSIVVTLSTI